MRTESTRNSISIDKGAIVWRYGKAISVCLAIIIIELTFSSCFPICSRIVDLFFICIKQSDFIRGDICFESITFFIYEIRIKTFLRIICFYSEFNCISFSVGSKFFSEFCIIFLSYKQEMQQSLLQEAPFHILLHLHKNGYLRFLE